MTVYIAVVLLILLGLLTSLNKNETIKLPDTLALLIIVIEVICTIYLVVHIISLQ